jgi:hypothetical protein
LVLDDGTRIDQSNATRRALIQGDVDDTIDPIGRWSGPEIGLMAFGPARAFRLATLGFSASEGVCLAMLFATSLVQKLPQLAIVLFYFGEPAFQPVVLAPQGLDFRSQHCHTAA